MLTRILEPEVMDTRQDALAYDAMDHADVNRRFCEDLLAIADPRAVIDVGTGTARIPIELCRMHPRCHVVATDLSDHMLEVARENVARAGLTSRITLARADAKGSGPRMDASGAFDVVMSNSTVHHIPEPAQLFAELQRLAAPGALIFVRDLERPRDRATLDRLVADYAANDTPEQRGLFADSLRAALTVDEVSALFPSATVTRTSDRHWTLVARAAASPPAART